VVVKLTTAVLFIVGPVGMLVQAVPVFAQANAAAETIAAVEAELAGLAVDPAAAVESSVAFKRIELDGATFTYPAVSGEPAFGVGPLDFGLRRGEVVFLTGGNGSGKSTFLRLLTGLYRPDGGRLAVDGRTVLPEDMQAYRDRISAVFSDFHLFRRLHGLAAVAPERAAELLRLVDLEGITAFKGDRFEPIALSSGQRRRLMLVVALLEERPVLVLDEFAADLDPVFRRRFYEEILGRLKAAGKTIVAATHDERYFHVADRRLHLADGRFSVEPVW
jgi:putative ATP-binding cassette transporter